MDYQCLKAWIKKNHFPMPFMDQMLDKLVGISWYYFLDRYLRYDQISIALKDDQENITFTCPCGTLTFKRMSFCLCNASATFKDVCSPFLLIY